MISVYVYRPHKPTKAALKDETRSKSSDGKFSLLHHLLEGDVHVTNKLAAIPDRVID